MILRYWLYLPEVPSVYERSHITADVVSVYVKNPSSRRLSPGSPPVAVRLSHSSSWWGGTCSPGGSKRGRHAGVAIPLVIPRAPFFSAWAHVRHFAGNVLETEKSSLQPGGKTRNILQGAANDSGGGCGMIIGAPFCFLVTLVVAFCPFAFLASRCTSCSGRVDPSFLLPYGYSKMSTIVLLAIPSSSWGGDHGARQHRRKLMLGGPLRGADPGRSRRRCGGVLRGLRLHHGKLLRHPFLHRLHHVSPPGEGGLFQGVRGGTSRQRLRAGYPHSAQRHHDPLFLGGRAVCAGLFPRQR